MRLLDGLQFFTVAVEAGSFAAASRKLGVTPSAVSRKISQLEEELGVLLIARTTRSLQLTDDGRAFHERCVRILEELGEAREAIARSTKKPSGLLRVDAPAAFGRGVLAPKLPAFLARYPEIRVDLTLHDQFVDPIVEGLDVLVRIGKLRDSSLIARRLGSSRLQLCASPGYLRKHGTPRKLADLERHDFIGYLREGRPDDLALTLNDGSLFRLPTRGRANGNDASVSRTLALAGYGITQIFDFIAAESIASKKLVPLLEDVHRTEWPIHALYPKNRHLLPKVSAFLEFLRTPSR